jgi:hypothetical protein
MSGGSISRASISCHEPISPHGSTMGISTPRSMQCWRHAVMCVPRVRHRALLLDQRRRKGNLDWSSLLDNTIQPVWTRLALYAPDWLYAFQAFSGHPCSGRYPPRSTPLEHVTQQPVLRDAAPERLLCCSRDWESSPHDLTPCHLAAHFSSPRLAVPISKETINTPCTSERAQRHA